MLKARWSHVELINGSVDNGTLTQLQQSREWREAAAIKQASALPLQQSQVNRWVPKRWAPEWRTGPEDTSPQGRKEKRKGQAQAEIELLL